MKIITICGSLKFQKEIMVVAERLALLGNCVFTPVYHVIDNINITEDQLLNLKKAHLKKIELSNAVVIIDIDNYIGDSTKHEIRYAEKLGKEIIYYKDFIDENIVEN